MCPIELINISKKYPCAGNKMQDLLILEHLSLKINIGESYSITGKSGCGKSTLLHIAGSIDSPTSGNVICNGVDFATLNDNEKSRFRNKNIGFVFQANMLLEDFTALENVMMPALICNSNKKETREMAINLLKNVGLSDRINHRPSQLSGGEKQRIAICRALINKPSVILADEPTGALDEENASFAEDLLLKTVKNSGCALLLVTHNIEFAKKCDNVFLLQNRHLSKMGNKDKR